MVAAAPCAAASREDPLGHCGAIKNRLWLLLLVTWVLAACASVTGDIRVETQSGPGVVLGNFRSYSWLAAGETVNEPSGNWKAPGLDADTEIRAALKRELARYGLREVASEPDLVVAFTAGINPGVLRIVEDPDTRIYTLQNAPKAALVVVFIDPRSRRPVWVGTAVGEAGAGHSAAQVRRRIDYAVTEMLRAAPR